MTTTATKTGTIGVRLARPFRVLNLDAPSGPLAMIGRDNRWCLTRDEALEVATFAVQGGYRVEIVETHDVVLTHPVPAAPRDERKGTP